MFYIEEKYCQPIVTLFLRNYSWRQTSLPPFFLCGYCPLPTICHAILRVRLDRSGIELPYVEFYSWVVWASDTAGPKRWHICCATWMWRSLNELRYTFNNCCLYVVTQQTCHLLDTPVAVGHPSPCIMCMLRRAKEPRVVAWLHLGMWHALLSTHYGGAPGGNSKHLAPTFWHGFMHH